MISVSMHEATGRSCETPEQRQKRLDDKRAHEATQSSCETPEQCQKRLDDHSLHHYATFYC